MQEFQKTSFEYLMTVVNVDCHNLFSTRVMHILILGKYNYQTCQS